LSRPIYGAALCKALEAPYYARMSTAHETPPARLTPIGPWVFDATDGCLRGADGTRKMEDRTARTLELLCAHRGAIVSQTMILEAVWKGRHVSPNSVAVVVADLRRALGDDAREPLYIETVAKRGYRLKDDPSAAPALFVPRPARNRRRRQTYRVLLSLAIAFVLAGTVAVFSRLTDHRPAHLRIAVEPVRNETGLGGYAALASAMSELLVDRIAAFDAVDVYRQTAAGTVGTTALIVRSKLILWNGIPTLSMTTEDGDGHVVWTGMAEGAPDTLAQKTLVELATLRKRIQARNAISGGAARP